MIEVGVPDLQRLPFGETVSHHYRVEDGQLHTFSVPRRYVWPSELDLIARIAGVRLRERRGEWNRSPFTRESTKYISVWQKAV